jgi:hypothetical protein
MVFADETALTSRIKASVVQEVLAKTGFSEDELSALYRLSEEVAKRGEKTRERKTEETLVA